MPNTVPLVFLYIYVILMLPHLISAQSFVHLIIALLAWYYTLYIYAYLYLLFALSFVHYTYYSYIMLFICAHLA